VVSRALTNFEGGLTILREAGEDAVNWLIILVATIQACAQHSRK